MVARRHSTGLLVVGWSQYGAIVDSPALTSGVISTAGAATKGSGKDPTIGPDVTAREASLAFRPKLDPKREEAALKGFDQPVAFLRLESDGRLP